MKKIIKRRFFKPRRAAASRAAVPRAVDPRAAARPLPARHRPAYRGPARPFRFGPATCAATCSLTRAPATGSQPAKCTSIGAGGVPKGPVTRALIKDIVAKSLADMGYECPASDLDKFVRTATPVASRATTPVSSANSSRNHSPVRQKNKGKYSASSSSEEETTGSDSTIVGTDDESGTTSSAASETGTLTGSRSDSFSLV
ncbi:hypothetical protein EVAR_99364_1 [Eumeta japonica]|uniref:Uncharacterized protein n=1 Tax=Eumeta variegata TaxID=151549 RepID=A0A4C1YR65_EUMVA|nr:hypothetical protein EVAR_99364_1 [Eumeta japonica]